MKQLVLLFYVNDWKQNLILKFESAQIKHSITMAILTLEGNVVCS